MLIIFNTLREKCPNTEFFSGPYFPVFGMNTEIYGMNTEIYGVNLRIQSEYSKIQTRKNSVFGYFSRSHNNKQILILKPREHLATIEIMWHIPRNLMLLFFGRYQLFMMFICLSNSYSHMDFVTFKAILMLFYKMVGELACIS